MSGMDDFLQCQGRPEEGPCPLHGLTEAEREALRLTDEEQISAHEAMQEGEWQRIHWINVRDVECILATRGGNTLRARIEALADAGERDGRGNSLDLARQLRAALDAAPAPTKHNCSTCPDCIHDGNKCCGCYDDACCQPEAPAATEDKADDGCDCVELCSMGPTCPGGILAGLDGAGCWRDATHGGNHAPLFDGVLLDPGYCDGCDALRAAPAPTDNQYDNGLAEPTTGTAQ